jgi:hypothetical protein
MALQTSEFIYHPLSGLVASANIIRAIQLDAAEEHVAGVLQIPKTGTLKKIGIYVSARSAGDAVYRVTLETVGASVGVPVATAYADRVLYAVGAESADVTVPGAAGVQWIALNGTTGVSVTRGDLVSVVVRCVTRSTGYIIVGIGMRSGFQMTVQDHPYSYGYVGSTSTAYTDNPNVGLEYSDGIAAAPQTYPAVIPATEAWGSDDDPTYRGLLFTPTAHKSLAGFAIFLDTDSAADVILYDSDEYTALETTTLSIAQRRTATQGTRSYLYAASHELTIGQQYRLVVLPKDTTDITCGYITVTDDGAVTAMSGMDGGVNYAYTSINDAPTSEAHEWTNSAVKRPWIVPIWDKLSDGYYENLGVYGSGTVTKESGANARGGSGNCAKLNPTSTTLQLYWSFLVPVTASTAFTLKFWHKITSGFNGSLKVTVYDSDDDATLLHTIETVTLTDDGAYHEFTSSSLTPTDTGLCRVKIEALDGASTGDIYIDDLTVQAA